jgi:hypothetical protein
MQKKPFWETKDPTKKDKKLTDAQTQKAKRMAKQAGRPYPNLVDNARVVRTKNAKKSLSKPKRRTK